MKTSLAFRSIRTRIMTATALVIVAIVSAVVWVWASSERNVYRDLSRKHVQSLALALSQAWTNELQDQNWSQIRINMDFFLKDNKDVLYTLVSHQQLSNQIVAASPIEFQDQYIPDMVPLSVTEQALLPGPPRTVETFILQTIQLPNEPPRANPGERVIEAVSEIRTSANEVIGTIRIGISLRQVDQAVASAIQKALLVGVIGLGVGLAGAFILARELSEPVQRLQASAAKIAAGDLSHRAHIPL
ncbi:MAG: hypothetical protein VKJ46_15715, partial [Leptolyngbyaceae bacterium]|nr:hypothetical protein [Leptolyngbyaceae bacterium]